jgi:hypothetical protein
MTVSIDIQHNSIECHYAECRYAECRYAECRDHLNVMHSVVMLNVFMLTVIWLNVVMLSVVAPFCSNDCAAGSNITSDWNVKNLSNEFVILIFIFSIHSGYWSYAKIIFWLAFPAREISIKILSETIFYKFRKY